MQVETTQKSIGEIAFENGYENSSHFSRDAESYSAINSGDKETKFLLVYLK